MKKLLLFFIAILSFTGSSQSLNDYKYASIPSKFEFSISPDEFKMNTYTKMYLEKYGFEVYTDNENLPEDFASSRCNKVYVDVIKKNNFFTTILYIEVKDCQNNILFASGEGRSKEKAYAKSFPAALREAFSSFDAINHQYNGTNHSDKNQVKQNSVVSSVTYTANELQPTTTAVAAKTNSNQTKSASLFAQPISNGFQIINAEPKVIMKIYFTSITNVFLAEKENQKGALIHKNGEWFFEYQENGKVNSEKIDVDL